MKIGTRGCTVGQVKEAQQLITERLINRGSGDLRQNNLRSVLAFLDTYENGMITRQEMYTKLKSLNLIKHVTPEKKVRGAAAHPRTDPRPTESCQSLDPAPLSTPPPRSPLPSPPLPSFPFQTKGDLDLAVVETLFDVVEEVARKIEEMMPGDQGGSVEEGKINLAAFAKGCFSQDGLGGFVSLFEVAGIQ